MMASALLKRSLLWGLLLSSAAARPKFWSRRSPDVAVVSNDAAVHAAELPRDTLGPGLESIFDATQDQVPRFLEERAVAAVAVRRWWWIHYFLRLHSNDSTGYQPQQKCESTGAGVND
jgi:hypothetical protein